MVKSLANNSRRFFEIRIQYRLLHRLATNIADSDRIWVRNDVHGPFCQRKSGADSPKGNQKFTYSYQSANTEGGCFHNEGILKGSEKLSDDVVHIWAEMQEPLVISVC